MARRPPSASKSWPRPWAPVPQSTTICVPAAERTETHEVLPPNRSVVGPGLAMDPRVPQNRTSILYPLYLAPTLIAIRSVAGG